MTSPVRSQQDQRSGQQQHPFRWLRWVVIVIWAVILVGLSHAASTLSSATNDAAAAYLPATAQSTQVATLQSQALGGVGQPEADQAVVVFVRPRGLTPADLRAVAAARTVVADLATRTPGLGQPTAAKESADGKAMLFTADVTASQRQISSADHTAVDAIRSAVAAVAASVSPGLQTAVTGPAAVTADSGSGEQRTLLLTTIVIVVAILLLVYRSPVLWLLPLLSAVNAIVLAEAAAHGLASAGLTVSSLSASILTVLVFGVAADYALLLVHRYREELRRRTDVSAAMATALRRTAGTLLASASTVVLAMLCLLAASSGSLHGLGPVAAVAVAAAFLAQITLLPALLLVFGRWVFWPRIPRTGDEAREESRAWSAVGARLARFPGRAAVATSLLLAAAATALLGLHFTSNPVSALRGNTSATIGQQLVDAHFPQGAAAPLDLLAAPARAAAAAAAAHGTPGISSVTPAKPVAGYDSFTVTMSGDPYGTAGRTVIDTLRQRTAAADPGALVGGSPAVQLDIATAAGHDAAVLMPLIFFVVLVVTALLLRAVIAPLLMTAASVLSFAASFGLAVLLWGGLNYQGADPQIPIYIFLFLVAFGVDYNIFLVARIREEARLLGTRAGTLRGLGVTSGVITAAGIVLAGTFTALTQLPSVSIAEVGSAVAIGVLIDTLVVRSVLAPSLLLKLGDAAWLPSRPARPGATTARAGADAPEASRGN